MGIEQPARVGHGFRCAPPAPHIRTALQVMWIMSKRKKDPSKDELRRRMRIIYRKRFIVVACFMLYLPGGALIFYTMKKFPRLEYLPVIYFVLFAICLISNINTRCPRCGKIDSVKGACRTLTLHCLHCGFNMWKKP